MATPRQRPFFESLRALREQRNMGLARCARAAGVAEAIYTDWELGHDIPSRVQLQRVFGASNALLHCRPDEPERPRVSPPQPLATGTELSQAIAAARNAAGLPVGEVAKLLGVSVQTYEAWETGASTPENGCLSRLRDLYPEVDLLGGAAKATTMPTPPQSLPKGRPAAVAPTSTPSSSPVAPDGLAAAAQVAQIARGLRGDGGPVQAIAFFYGGDRVTFQVTGDGWTADYEGSTERGAVDAAATELRNEVDRRIDNLRRLLGGG